MKILLLMLLLISSTCFAVSNSKTTSNTKSTHDNSTLSQDYTKASKKVDKTLGNITGNQPSALNKHIKQQEKAASSPLGISFYKPTYVLPFYYTGSPAQSIYGNSTPNGQKIKKLEFKAQISLLIPVWTNMFGYQNTSLNLAYSQLMYWQFYAKSQYFRETDYEPEIFLSHEFHKNWWISLGGVHESNGRGGNFERSWNRVYTDLRFSGQHWMVSIKPWVLVFKADSSDVHNPDITRYLGNGRILVAYKFGRSEISFMSRNNLQSGFKRGAIVLAWSFHLWKHFYTYLQGFSGYGQSLIEYNHHTNSVGIGIALNDWL